MSYARDFARFAASDQDINVPADLAPFVVAIEETGPAHIVTPKDGGAPAVRRLPGRVFFSDTSVAVFGPNGSWYSFKPHPLRGRF